MSHLIASANWNKLIKKLISLKRWCHLENRKTQIKAIAKLFER